MSKYGGSKFSLPVRITEGGGGGSDYTLPTASASQLGGIKVGNGLAIDANGVLSLNVPNGNEVSF